jgi:hypothetical protein
MADLFSVTAPLAIRFKDGRRQVMIERAPHRGGLLFLPPFWITLGLDKSLVFAAGPVRGEAATRRWRANSPTGSSTCSRLDRPIRSVTKSGA